jgi:hypothetical protein
VSYKIAILRGCGQKPLLRYVSMNEKDVVIVRSERSYNDWLEGRGGSRWIGWPQGEPVFEYDESVFRCLEALYSRGAMAELKNEWLRCHALSEN